MKARLTVALGIGLALASASALASNASAQTGGTGAQEPTGQAQGAAKSAFSVSATSDWKTIRRQGQCVLIRTFGEGDTKTTLQLSLSGSQPFYNMSLAGELVRTPYSHIVDVQFGPDEAASRRSYVVNRAADGTPMMIMFGLLLAPVSAEAAEAGPIERLGKARETAIDRITFSRGVSRDFTLELGSMYAPLERLTTCASGAYVAYRRAPSDNNSLAVSAQPSGNPGTWIGPDDYPRDLIGARMGGTVGFRATVDEEGRAVSCQITSTNRPQMFDDTVCASVLRNARFTPALDAEGKPTVGFYSNQMQFQIVK